MTKLMTDQISELLTALEFCEGALLDAYTDDDGLDTEAARYIAEMCSELLVRHGRLSVIAESANVQD